MNRNSILSFIVVATGTGALLATTATSQFGVPKAYVNLQPTTPGTSQSGHANVSGTIRASQLVGGGAGVSGVNAVQLGGLASSAYGQISSTNLWTGANTFGNAGNSFVGNGAGLTNVNASLLGGLGSAAFGRLASENDWFSINNFSNSANSFTGNGAGLVSVNADLLDGINSTAFLQSIPNPLILSGTNSNAIIFGTNTTSNLEGAAAIKGVAFDDTTETYGGYFESNSTGLRVLGVNTGISAYSSSGTAVNARAGQTGARLFGESLGVYAESDNLGLFAKSYNSVAIQADGASSGGIFNAINSSSSGIEANSSGDVFGVGVFGTALASTGTGTGVWGDTFSTLGSGVRGSAKSTTGINYGGYFQSFSPQGYGGYITGIGPDALYVQNTGGGRGIFVSTNSDTAIWANVANAFASVDARNAGPSGWGVFGFATHSSGGNAGVVGQTSSPAGWGVYSFGNLGATGVKSFRIDHPFDPENKYLLHYASESPMPQNFYVGNVITDANGYSWVELPDYFEEINTNFKYQLTVVDGPNSGDDDFVQVKVRQKIKDGRFLIRTSAPNTEVSWRVDADRNDLYVRDRKPKDVVEKQGRERGTYQHPELYGMPEERGMNYRPEAVRPVNSDKPKR